MKKSRARTTKGKFRDKRSDTKASAIENNNNSLLLS